MVERMFCIITIDIGSVVVFEGDADRAAGFLQQLFNPHIKSLECDPLRKYQGFAERILKVPADLIEGTDIELPRQGNVYWITADIEYEG